MQEEKKSRRGRKNKLYKTCDDLKEIIDECVRTGDFKYLKSNT